MSAVSFGIAGWSYADWRGVVYPENCKDTLRQVARYVDFIEINSTFYRTPDAELCESWLRRTQDHGTFFTAKLPREITHERRLTDELAATVRGGFAPLADAGRLRAVLAQFPHWFRAGDASLEHLERIASAFSSVAPLVLEVRDRSWGEPVPLARVSELGYSLAHLDYPGAFDARSTEVFGPRKIAYFRLHGRNSAAWFDKNAQRDEVYDYRYDASEVAEIRGHIGRIAAAASGGTLVVANNHYLGKAMALTLELIAAWKRAKVDVPDPLIRAQPGLRSIARAAQGELF